MYQVCHSGDYRLRSSHEINLIYLGWPGNVGGEHLLFSGYTSAWWVKSLSPSANSCSVQLLSRVHVLVISLLIFSLKQNLQLVSRFC